jgi:hypothetical protein
MRKAILALPVCYSEGTTGSEVTSALNQLLETALSTPGILGDADIDEVGDFELEYDGDVFTGDELSERDLLVRLAIDGPLLAKQRAVLDFVVEHRTYNKDMKDMLSGLSNMLNVIADQLHDIYGVPCLLEGNDGDEDCPSTDAG